MGRPAQGYFVGEQRVPSVTTILSRFKESGGLVHWAWRLGMEGKDYREERDSAAGAGTLAHNMVEAWLKGEPVVASHDDPQVLQRAQTSFSAFLDWANQSELHVTETEVPLISKTHLYGGTLDAILIKGKRAMGDWKTSNNVYPEYLIQLAAYRGLWEENFPDEPIDGGFHLVRFDKEFADFHHHYWPELDTAWKSFLLMRELYEHMKELKRRAS